MCRVSRVRVNRKWPMVSNKDTINSSTCLSSHSKGTPKTQAERAAPSMRGRTTYILRTDGRKRCACTQHRASCCLGSSTKSIAGSTPSNRLPKTFTVPCTRSARQHKLIPNDYHGEEHTRTSSWVLTGDNSDCPYDSSLPHTTL